jgi:DNA-binding transcriptional LysR family regulator
VTEAAATADAVLVVGFSTSVGRDLLPAVTLRFSERRPGWRIRLRQVDWRDPTAGVADHGSDVAYVWLPLPDPDRYGRLVVAVEDRHVALPAGHRLAVRARVPFTELLDEPILALPPDAGPLRDHWIATDARDGQPATIAGEITTVDETLEAIANGTGIALISAGNAAIYRRDGIVTRPVDGIGPSELALVWRRDDPRPVVRDFVDCHPRAG